MPIFTFDLPWTTYIAEVVNQSGLTVNLPATPYRPCAAMLGARALGEVQDFTLAGATSMTARMGLQFVNHESENPTVVLIGPTFNANGWLGPGGGGFTDIASTAAQFRRCRGIWQLTLTLASGTARPFLRAAGSIQIKLQ